MDPERLKELLRQHPIRTRWEYVNFTLEPYGEFTGRAILSQLHRLNEIHQAQEDSDSIDLENERDQIVKWLDSFSETEIAEQLATIENTEADYWIQRLGREAAVDMISGGRISRATLERAILLDEDSYRKFTETCNTIIKVVGDVTRDVELQMGLVPNQDQLPEGQPR